MHIVRGGASNLLRSCDSHWSSALLHCSSKLSLTTSPAINCRPSGLILRVSKQLPVFPSQSLESPLFSRGSSSSSSKMPKGQSAGLKRPRPSGAVTATALNAAPVPADGSDGSLGSVLQTTGLSPDLVAFINHAWTPFHAVEEASRRLLASGFVHLSERDQWDVKPGGEVVRCFFGGEYQGFEA